MNYYYYYYYYSDDFIYHPQSYQSLYRYRRKILIKIKKKNRLRKKLKK